ncbi:Uncharacterised protein [Serratia marcescens]|uniref:hypothetical protein n=1 Tax=Serratia TaxID=613 RepID=UPI0007455503|nr:MULTISPECIES: hypothetical protein [Serratia]RLO34937.1 hypothetical protein CLM69_13495 [Serratia marcescens]CUZ54482.1 Uncharacterised protein [Serratia marcescens]CUZ57695.1 Uncharacterised protein [Serratia marcescens]CUZ61515.1 Uncharacterised protein [Serratia marcescens]CUZ81504.1 Uncharacterised protein [Serratia marcescens]
MKNIVENQYIKIDNSDFSFLTNQKPWLKIPADGSPLTFTGNADEAAKEFFNALIRVRDGYISALKAERDALADRVNALAVESKTLSDALSLISRCYKHSPHIQSMCVVETPATSAALAAIQAQGVEKFADFLDSPIDGQHCYQNEVGLARHFASTLREAK